jgi:DNA-binding beta-propeller fold protein YncE
LDARGRLYINREDKGDIAVIDLIARKVVTTYPMPGCVAPTGLLLAPGDRLISSCANGVAQITNSRTGRMLASLKIGVGPDAVLYDRARNLAYIPSGRAGSLAVIALTGPRANTVIDIVPTQVGARTGAVDIKTGRIYLPTAEYGPPLAPGQRPVMKPGTFQVLVLGRN